MDNDTKGTIAAIAFVVLIAYGWFANMYKLSQCDFASPYKTEVLRTVGIFMFPMGVVMGYLTIEDK